jgi:hypothetical protein
MGTELAKRNKTELAKTHDMIRTLQDLWVARVRRQSVWIPGNTAGICGPKPAAFIMNLTGEQIMRMIERGLQVYRPAPDPRKHATGRSWPAKKRGVGLLPRTPGVDVPF